ncbi:MAG: KH domain-containing protein [Myxococcales bacterium]|nr:KH domain-containing protein [Myxococcales bacterium]
MSERETANGTLELARDAARELVTLMGYEAEVSARYDDDEQLWVELDGEDIDRLIGKKGQTLDALQLVLAKIVGRQIDDAPPLTLDVGGYRRRRAASLEELAFRLKDKVLESGKAVALNPMSARDRRIIHMTLRDVEGVATRSEGEGLDRRLLIVPA